MGNDSKTFKDQQGAALIATLMFLMALGVLSTALIVAVNNEMKSSTSYKYGQQAFYVAKAGAESGVSWFVNSYSPHVPASDYNATTLPIQYAGNSVLLAGQTGSTSVYPEAAAIAAFSARSSERR